jgi:hypothetical protein
MRAIDCPCGHHLEAETDEVAADAYEVQTA